MFERQRRWIVVYLMWNNVEGRVLAMGVEMRLPTWAIFREGFCRRPQKIFCVSQHKITLSRSTTYTSIRAQKRSLPCYFTYVSDAYFDLESDVKAMEVSRIAVIADTNPENHEVFSETENGNEIFVLRLRRIFLFSIHHLFYMAHPVWVGKSEKFWLDKFFMWAQLAICMTYKCSTGVTRYS